MSAAPSAPAAIRPKRRRGRVAVVVVVQSAWLQPELDERVASIIAGIEPPPSHLHTVYGIVEVAKVAALGLLAAWADPQPRRRTVL